MANECSIPAPAAVTAHAPSTWHQTSNGADLVILAHRAFPESGRPLQPLHEGQGLQVAPINVEALYAEYSIRAKTPWAPRAFLQHASTR